MRLGKYDLDLTMGAEQGQRRGFHLGPLGARQAAVEIQVTRRPVAMDQALAADTRAGGNRPPQCFRRQRRVHPLFFRHGVQLMPLRQVMAAMIGGQHDRIVDPVTVQPVKESAQFPVQPVDLDAAFSALGPVTVADIVRGGQADGDKVGLCLPTQFHAFDRGGGEGQGHRIQFGRYPETADNSRRALKTASANGFVLAYADREILCHALLGQFKAGIPLRDALRIGFVHLLDQRRDRHASIAHKALGTHPPDMIRLRPPHHDRRPVLARDRHDPRRRVGGLHPVAQCRDAKMYR